MHIINTTLSSLWRVLRSSWRYLGDVMGERDYEKYVAYLQRYEPCAPIPSEREFWRMRWDDQERNPQGRCC